MIQQWRDAPRQFDLCTASRHVEDKLVDGLRRHRRAVFLEHGLAVLLGGVARDAQDLRENVGHDNSSGGDAPRQFDLCTAQPGARAALSSNTRRVPSCGSRPWRISPNMTAHGLPVAGACAKSTSESGAPHAIDATIYAQVGASPLTNCSVDRSGILNEPSRPRASE